MNEQILKLLSIDEYKRLDNIGKKMYWQWREQVKQEDRKRVQEELRSRRRARGTLTPELLKKYKHDYRIKHKEWLSVKAKQYYLKNKERIKERARQYRLSNYVTIIERERNYQKTNRERRCEIQKEYYQRNRERINFRHQIIYNIKQGNVTTQ